MENQLIQYRNMLLKAAWRLEANSFYQSDSAKALCSEIRELVGPADVYEGHEVRMPRTASYPHGTYEGQD